VEALASASRQIGETMRSAPVPEAVRAEIGRRYDGLAAATAASPAVAVRSSALGEDSAEATFAGQQDTYLWVRGAGDICGAVRDCWASLYSAEAISYRERLGSADRPAMGVTIQLMVDAEVSGVMFTCNPVSGDPSVVAINASWGLGVAVVGGEVTPDDYLVSKVTRETIRETISDKQIAYVAATGGRGTVRTDVPEERRHARCVDRPALAELVTLARTVEAHFGGHQDIEWAIAPGPDAVPAIYVLQSRPVTAVRKPAPPPPASAMSLVMSKFGAPPKEAS
jgi:pyruvate,water dikinase